jgi:hypothetical protein
MTVFTTLDFLKPGAKWPPDKDRLARYAKNRLLLEGDHDLVFAGLNEDDAPRIIKMRVNWFKRIMTYLPTWLWGTSGNPGRREPAGGARSDHRRKRLPSGRLWPLWRPDSLRRRRP